MKRMHLHAAVIAALAGVLPSSAAAEPALRFDGLDRPAGEVSVSSGFANAVAPLGIEGSMAFPTARRPIIVSVGLTVPMLRFDLADHRIDARVSLPIFEGAWDAPVSAGVRGVSTSNDAFSATALGTVLAVRPGYHARRWALAAELEVWTAWATHLRTTRFAVEVGGARPFDGWHPLTAAAARVGIRPAVRFGDVVLDLRAGYEHRGEMNLVIPPFYASLGVGYRL